MVSWLAKDDFIACRSRRGARRGDHRQPAPDPGGAGGGSGQSETGRATRENKVSLRSTDGGLNVAAIAQKRGGGGHVQAAGFSSADDMATILDWIEAEVRDQTADQDRGGMTEQDGGDSGSDA